jgi:hypothetical protein
LALAVGAVGVLTDELALELGASIEATGFVPWVVFVLVCSCAPQAMKNETAEINNPVFKILINHISFQIGYRSLVAGHLLLLNKQLTKDE